MTTEPSATGSQAAPYSPPPKRRPVGQRAGQRPWRPQFIDVRFTIWLTTVKPVKLSLIGAAEVIWDLSPVIATVMPGPIRDNPAGSCVEFVARLERVDAAEDLQLAAVLALGHEFALPADAEGLPADVFWENTGSQGQAGADQTAAALKRQSTLVIADFRQHPETALPGPVAAA